MGTHFETAIHRMRSSAVTLLSSCLALTNCAWICYNPTRQRPHPPSPRGNKLIRTYLGCLFWDDHLPTARTHDQVPERIQLLPRGDPYLARGLAQRRDGCGVCGRHEGHVELRAEERTLVALSEDDAGDVGRERELAEGEDVGDRLCVHDFLQRTNIHHACRNYE